MSVVFLVTLASVHCLPKPQQPAAAGPDASATILSEKNEISPDGSYVYG